MVEYAVQMNMDSIKPPVQRAAVVGVVGRTNAGKSTIVNRMVGEKVTIVSPVEQTTRNTIRGIVADERGQLVLLDTPGLHKAVGPLGKLLNGMARASSAGTDILCVVFDAAHAPQLEDEGWMARVAKERPQQVRLRPVLCDDVPRPLEGSCGKAPSAQEAGIIPAASARTSLGEDVRHASGRMR